MKTLLACLALCGLLLPVHASAYDKNFLVELHMGVTSPDESIGDVDLDAGYLFSSSISYNFLNDVLGVYVNFGSDIYDADSNSNPRVDAVFLTGIGAGMTHQGTFPGGKLGYYVRLGLHSSELSLVDSDADEIDETRSEIGLQTSAGVQFNFSDSWAIRGGLKYKTFSKELRINRAIDAELNSLALIFGGVFRF